MSDHVHRVDVNTNTCILWNHLQLSRHKNQGTRYKLHCDSIVMEYGINISRHEPHLDAQIETRVCIATFNHRHVNIYAIWWLLRIATYSERRMETQPHAGFQVGIVHTYVNGHCGNISGFNRHAVSLDLATWNAYPDRAAGLASGRRKGLEQVPLHMPSCCDWSLFSQG